MTNDSRRMFRLEVDILATTEQAHERFERLIDLVEGLLVGGCVWLQPEEEDDGDRRPSLPPEKK